MRRLRKHGLKALTKHFASDFISPRLGLVMLDETWGLVIIHDVTNFSDPSVSADGLDVCIEFSATILDHVQYSPVSRRHN